MSNKMVLDAWDPKLTPKQREWIDLVCRIRTLANIELTVAAIEFVDYDGPDGTPKPVVRCAACGRLGVRFWKVYPLEGDKDPLRFCADLDTCAYRLAVKNA